MSSSSAGGAIAGDAAHAVTSQRLATMSESAVLGNSDLLAYLFEWVDVHAALPVRLVNKLFDEVLRRHKDATAMRTTKIRRLHLCSNEMLEWVLDMNLKVITQPTDEWRTNQNDEIVKHKQRGAIAIGIMQTGNMELLKDALNDRRKYAVLTSVTYEYAAGRGDISLLEWLKSYKPKARCQWDSSSCTAAAANGHLETLKWLRNREKPCLYSTRTCASAAANGHLDVLKWLLNQYPRCPHDSATTLAAVEGGHLELLDWLVHQAPVRFLFAGYEAQFAATKGDLPMLQYLRQLLSPHEWTLDFRLAIPSAAGNGQLEVLKWIRAQHPPFPWDERACYEAAGHGKIEVLQWLRNQDPPCPWNEVVCDYAAAAGDLTVLKWLRAQNPPCPWRKEATRHAVRCNHLEMLKWMVSQTLRVPWIPAMFAM